MTVRAILDLKGSHVVCVSPDIKLTEAVKVLAERGIGAVLVLQGERIEGILSERDVVQALGRSGPEVMESPVGDVMTRMLVTCTGSDTVAAIMEVMTQRKIRHLPVVENGDLAGLISIGDVVKWRVGEYEAEQEALREYITTA